MREERGQIGGDAVIAEPYTLWGSVAGKVNVVEGGIAAFHDTLLRLFKGENIGKLVLAL